MFKELEIDKKSFVAGWFLPTELCDEIVNVFENNKKLAIPGKLGAEGEVDNSQKQSLDLSVGADYFDFPFDYYRNYLQICLDSYLEKYEWCNEQPNFNVCESYNIQWYPPGGGFKVWHFENTGQTFSRHRSLVFMTYLNDVIDGGTEFLYQDIQIPATKGLTLIWPPYWTHTHKGSISKNSQKYIVTGWFNYIDQYNQITKNNY